MALLVPVMRTLQSERLLLEPQLAIHAREMFGVLSDPAIYEYENAPPVSELALEERFRKLESRISPDGSERWLNWVVRLKTGGLIGYVQATLEDTRRAWLAYELSSTYWGKGFGSEAVVTMVNELLNFYQAKQLCAVLKRNNSRSRHLLDKLGFVTGTSQEMLQCVAGSAATVSVDSDELLMCRSTVMIFNIDEAGIGQQSL